MSQKNTYVHTVGIVFKSLFLNSAAIKYSRYLNKFNPLVGQPTAGHGPLNKMSRVRLRYHEGLVRVGELHKHHREL